MNVNFKVGDKVRLKREFYNEKVFEQGGYDRSGKKLIADCGSEVKTIKYVEGGLFCSNLHFEDMGNFNYPSDCFDLIPSNCIVEIDRPAKVGEWIKIIKTLLAGNEYKVGDILQVRMLNHINTENIYAKGIDRLILYPEYVVLENYVPEQSKVKIPVNVNEKLGFKIGEEVMYREGKRTILAFSTRRNDACYITGFHTEPTMYNDRPIIGSWDYCFIYELTHIKPQIRKWTPEEIAEARNITLDEIIKLNDECFSVVIGILDAGEFYDQIDKEIMSNKKRAFCCYNKTYDSQDQERFTYAVACPTDEWNNDIGHMVAVCKASGRKLPDWINKK